MGDHDQSATRLELRSIDTEGLGEPYRRQLAALRGAGSVCPAVDEDGVQVTLVTTYDAAREVLGDNVRIRNHLAHARPAFADAGIELTDERIAFGAAHLVHADPPDHTRLRRLVNRAFASRAVAALGARIEAITNELLDRVDPDHPVEMVAALNQPLPVRIISELLGVPAADRPEFRQWCEAAVTPEHVVDVPMGKAEGRRLLQRYLADLVAERARPGNVEATAGGSLLDELLRAGQQEDRISTDEVVAMAYILFLAGHESTVNFLGNAELHLAENPTLFDRLRAEPSLIPAAVEELLRLVGPVQRATIRVATDPVGTAGTVGDEIEPGSVVSVCLAAANRDPQVFDQPDSADFGADRAPHLAFGHGPHFCVGAALARSEARVVLTELTRRYRRLLPEPAGAAVRWRRSFQRGPAELLLRLER